MKIELNKCSIFEDCHYAFYKCNKTSLMTSYIVHPQLGGFIQSKYAQRYNFVNKKDAIWLIELDSDWRHRSHMYFEFSESESEKIADSLEEFKRLHEDEWELWGSSVKHTVEVLEWCKNFYNANGRYPISQWLNSGLPWQTDEDFALFSKWPINQDPKEWLHSFRGKRLSAKFGI